MGICDLTQLWEWGQLYTLLFFPFSPSLPLLPSPSLSFFLLSSYCFLSFQKHTFPNTQAEILFPLHVVLQVFPLLPPSAAHFLFNNFVGIIMWHTDQPGTHSAKITQSVLTLTGMVSVELDRILPSIPTLPLSLHLLPFSSLPLLLLLLASPSLSFLLPLLFSSFPSFPPFLPPSLPLLSQIFYSFSFLPSTLYVTFLSYSPSIPPSSFSSAPHLLPPHPFLPSSTFCLPSPYLSLSPALPPSLFVFLSLCFPTSTSLSYFH